MYGRVLGMTVGLLSLFVFTGCTSMTDAIPACQPPLGPVGTTATYDILGGAQGTSTGGYLFGFIPIGIESKSGSIGERLVPFRDPIMAAAIYNAIDSKPGADALIAVRWKRVTTNYLLYAQSTVTVKGKAIRYNQSAP